MQKNRRVIKYKGNGKVNALKEQVFTKGYAVQFDDVTDYVMNLIPQEEINSERREKSSARNDWKYAYSPRFYNTW